jgi:hypothetical protein
MWFFMYSCYLFSVISFGLLCIAFLQSFLHFTVIEANEITFIIFTSIVYLFTETLIIFFFVGTGVSIKEFTLDKKLKPDYHKQSIAIKRKVYPPQLLNILLMMLLFILVGAVDTGRCPRWVYQVYFTFCLYHFVRAKLVQHWAFRENTVNILAMAGLEYEQPVTLS